MNINIKTIRPSATALITLFAIAFLFISVADGTEPLALSVDESVNLALEHSKVLHASKMDVNAAGARVHEINASRLPTVKFDGAYARLSDVPEAGLGGLFPGMENVSLVPALQNSYSLGITVQQPLFTGLKLEKAASAAGYRLQATREIYEISKADIAYGTKSAYWDLFRMNELARLAADNVTRLGVHVNDVHHLYDLGMVTNNDVLRVEVQLSEARLQQIDAENGVELARLNLNNTMGLPLDTQIELRSKADITSDSAFDIQSAIKGAEYRRPELSALGYQLGAARAGVAVARAAFMPQVYLFGKYNYDRPNQRVFPTRDRFDHTWQVGLAISFDIWNWGGTISQTTQAQAQASKLQDQLNLLRDSIVLEVTQDALNLKRTSEKIAVAEKGVAQAEENYRVAGEKFKRGLMPSSDLIDANTMLIQAKTEYTTALVDYKLAAAKLERSTGN